MYYFWHWEWSYTGTYHVLSCEVRWEGQERRGGDRDTQYLQVTTNPGSRNSGCEFAWVRWLGVHPIYLGLLQVVVQQKLVTITNISNDVESRPLRSPISTPLITSRRFMTQLPSSIATVEENVSLVGGWPTSWPSVSPPRSRGVHQLLEAEAK